MADEAALFPYSHADLRGARVLVVAPHPDDETIGCGGALTLHRRARDPVRVVFVTSGDKGGRPDEPGADVSDRREREAERALAVLGLEDWTFWREPDRGVVADGCLVERLVQARSEFKPTLVYAPSPVDLHPDHRAVAAALQHSLRGSDDPLRVAFYETSFAAPVNALVDITSVWTTKEAALRCYESQLASHFDYVGAATGLARFRTLTLGRSTTAAEGFHLADGRHLERSPIWRWGELQEPTPTTGTPAVSVIVRTRDRARLLREALGSLAAQTFRDFEVVVINDGGEDVAPALAEFPELRIRYIHLDAHRGRSGAANAGCEAATGEWIAYLDDDDVYYPTHLESLQAALKAQPDFAVAYSDVHDASYRREPDSDGYRLNGRTRLGADFDRERLLFENYIPSLALMHRREAWARVGRFDPELIVFEDWDLVLRLSREFDFLHVTRCTAEYRRRRGGSSAMTSLKESDREAAIERIYRRHWHHRTPAIELQHFQRRLQDERYLRRRVETLERELARRRPVVALQWWSKRKLREIVEQRLNGRRR